MKQFEKSWKKYKTQEKRKYYTYAHAHHRQIQLHGNDSMKLKEKFKKNILRI